MLDIIFKIHFGCLKLILILKTDIGFGKTVLDLELSLQFPGIDQALFSWKQNGLKSCLYSSMSMSLFFNFQENANQGNCRQCSCIIFLTDKLEQGT